MRDTKTCGHCGKKFERPYAVPPYAFRRRKFCSSACISESKHSAYMKRASEEFSKSKDLRDFGERMGVCYSRASQLRIALGKTKWLNTPGPVMTLEKPIFDWLRKMRIRVRKAKGTDSYDAVAYGKRLEFKRANLHSRHWSFAISRNGKLDESQVDLYVFRLDRVPGFRNAIHLIVPSPLKASRISISLRGLVTRWGQYYNRIDLIR